MREGWILRFPDGNIVIFCFLGLAVSSLIGASEAKAFARKGVEPANGSGARLRDASEGCEVVLFLSYPNDFSTLSVSSIGDRFGISSSSKWMAQIDPSEEHP